MAALSKNWVENLETLVFVLVFIRLLLLVPDGLIIPACGAGVAVAAAAVYGIRAYLWRLERLAKRLEGGASAATLSLKAPERVLLDLRGEGQDGAALLRRRQSAIRKFGEFIGTMGVCAFMVLLVLLGED